MQSNYFNKQGVLTVEGKQLNRKNFIKLERLGITIQSVDMFCNSGWRDPEDSDYEEDAVIEDEITLMPVKPIFTKDNKVITYYNNFSVNLNSIVVYTGENYDGTIAFQMSKKHFKTFNKSLKEFGKIDYNNSLVVKYYNGNIIIVFKLSISQMNRINPLNVHVVDTEMFGQKVTVHYNYQRVPISGVIMVHGEETRIKAVRSDSISILPEYTFLEMMYELKDDPIIDEEPINIIEEAKMDKQPLVVKTVKEEEDKKIRKNEPKDVTLNRNIYKKNNISISEDYLIIISRILCNKGDTEIAQFFKVMYPDNYIYDSKNKCWYTLNKYGIYKRDTDELLDARIKISGDVIRKYMELVSPLIKNAEGYDKENILNTNKRVINAFNKLSGKKNTIESLKEQYIVKELQQKMNYNVNLFAFENGVYDMSTFMFRTATPKDMVFETNGYKYIPSTKIDRKLVKDTIKDMFLTDELYNYFMTIISLRLVRVNELEEFYFLIGDASNGKGLVTSLIQNTFGHFSQILESSSFYKNKHGVHADSATPALASTKDSNIVFVNELDRETKLTADTIKKLSGNDKVKVRFLRQDCFEFIPGYSLFFVSNHRPNIDGDDFGIQRRLKFIPFNVTFKDHPTLPNERKVNRQLKQLFKDKKYFCALFDVLVKFYKEYINSGQEINVPKEVLVNSDNYLSENDPVKQFVDNCLEITKIEGDIIASAALNETFKAYNNGIRGYTPAKLKMRLDKDFGITSKKTNKGMVYFGIKEKEIKDDPIEFAD